MKPISICHALDSIFQGKIKPKSCFYFAQQNRMQTNVFEDKKHILINVFLTDEDKELIYKYHMSKNPDSDYKKEDVSMLAFVKLQYGEVNILTFENACYYPETQGEMEIPNKYLTKEFMKECTKFILFNYYGNEAKYDNA